MEPSLTRNNRQWRLEHYGGLLLALEAALLNDEEFLRIGRETKSIQEVVTRLLELCRADEAVQDASQANGLQWTTYIAWLRKRHSRLVTLKEELAAAGL